MLPIRTLALAAMATVGLAAQIYYVDPDSIPQATRDNWCVAQKASCPLLCLQNPTVQDATTASNECEASDLSYSCICGNGFQPDVANYSQTIPFFECQEYGNQCVNACGNGNTPCQSACRTDNPCGAQNPYRVNTTSSSTMAATATSGTATSGPAIYTGLGGSSSSSSSSKSSDNKSGSNSILEMGHGYGLAVVLSGMFAGFMLVL